MNKLNKLQNFICKGAEYKERIVHYYINTHTRGPPAHQQKDTIGINTSRKYHTLVIKSLKRAAPSVYNPAWRQASIRKAKFCVKGKVVAVTGTPGSRPTAVGTRLYVAW
jgi:hypothetical protein